MKNQDSTPVNALLETVGKWSGVSVDIGGSLPTIRLKDRVIARFPDEESCEAVLFGHLRTQVHDDPDELPKGVWPTEDYERILIDLSAPGGMESAIRVLMNSYIAAKAPRAGEWWLKPESIRADPEGRTVVETMRRHRDAAMVG